MAGAAQTAQSNPWGGGQSPFRMSYGKMMMWFFLVSDAFTFSAFLTAYGFMRHRFEDIWPVAGDVFTHFPFYDGHIELAYVGLMTFILIMSSVTMVLAVEAGHRMDKKSVIKWMILTIIGGFIFLGSQAWEWYHFIHGTPDGAIMLADGTIYRVVEGGLMLPGKLATLISGAEAQSIIDSGTRIFGANLHVNEYGHRLFGDFFFFITGFHGFHVFSGVMINIVILAKVMAGEFEKKGHYEMVEKTGLYWHFVDLVWVFVFTFFYLL
jgi:cytochrome c oxidase subunit III